MVVIIISSTTNTIIITIAIVIVIVTIITINYIFDIRLSTLTYIIFSFKDNQIKSQSKQEC